MNDGLIPNRYAKALYKIASENNNTGEVYEQMKLLDESYSSQAELKKAANNPYLPIDDKLRLLCVAANADMDSTAAKFMALVIRKNRINFLRPIALAYMKQYREINGIAKVEIVTATTMNDDEINDIVDVVKKQLGDRTIELSTAVNPDLIGGFTVSVDSRVLDASVKSQLENLRLKLLS